MPSRLVLTLPVTPFMEAPFSHCTAVSLLEVRRDPADSTCPVTRLIGT